MASFAYVVRFLGNRNVVLLASIVAGLVWPAWAAPAERLVLIALAAVMTVSLLDVTGVGLGPIRRLLLRGLTGILLNYVLLTGAILGLTFLILRDSAFRAGFVLIAAVPPAVAVVPFTAALRGDVSLAMVGNVAAYLAGLVLTPFIAVVWLGETFIKPGRLALIVVELILAPLVASRILLRLGPLAQRVKGQITNWGFFLITYVVVGLNRDLLIDQPGRLVPVAAIALFTTIGLGALIDGAGSLLNVRREGLIPVVLLGTLKNYGLAGGLALTLFDRVSAVPATVSSIFLVVYIIYLDLVGRFFRQ